MIQYIYKPCNREESREGSGERREERRVERNVNRTELRRLRTKGVEERCGDAEGESKAEGEASNPCKSNVKLYFHCVYTIFIQNIQWRGERRGERREI